MILVAWFVKVRCCSTSINPRAWGWRIGRLICTQIARGGISLLCTCELVVAEIQLLQGWKLAQLARDFPCEKRKTRGEQSQKTTTSSNSTMYVPGTYLPPAAGKGLYIYSPTAKTKRSKRKSKQGIICTYEKKPIRVYSKKQNWKKGTKTTRKTN